MNHTNTTIPWTELQNETFNKTENQTDLGPFYNSLKWISLCILICDVVFNMLAIVLLYVNKKRTRMGFFVKNLAFADLAVGLFFILPETLFSWFEVEWTKYVCYLYYGYFSMVAFYVSTYAIVVMAIDRLYVILRPVSAISKGNMYRYGLVMPSWILGLLLGIQYAVHIDYDGVYCRHAIPYKQVILYFDLFVILIIPVLVITTCYTLIVVTIWRRAREGFVLMRRHAASENDNTRTIQSKDRIITTAKIKTIKLLFIVVTAYVFCWTPITVAAFLDHYGVVTVGRDERIIYSTLFVFAPLNSLSNPLIFLLFNRKMFFPKKKKTDRSRSPTSPFSSVNSTNL